MLSTVREKVSAFKQYLAASKKRTFTFAITILVLIALPLMVIVSQQQQTIRQRASELVSSPPPGNAVISINIDPTEISQKIGETFSVPVFLHAKENNITGVDITIMFDKEVLELVGFEKSPVLTNQLINTVDNQAGTLHYAATETSSPQNTGDIKLGALSFKTNSKGVSNITFQNVQITSLGNSLPLNTEVIPGKITIVTEPIPTSIPINTSTTSSTIDAAPKPVNLFSVHSSVPNGSGQVTVGIISYDFSINLAKVRLQGKLNNLLANRQYTVMLCLKSGSDCGTRTTPEIVTDKSGNITFSGVEFSIFNRDNNPVNQIKVVEQGKPGIIPTCDLASKPCLMAYYSFPNPIVTVSPSTTPSPSPTATIVPTNTPRLTVAPPTLTPTPTRTPTPIPPTSIIMTPQTLTSGNNIVVSWNVTDASANDYIRVLTATGSINAGPNGISPSNNCNLNNIPGTTVVKTGSCSFTSATIRDLGIFKLGYYNSKGTLLATSTNFTVIAASKGTLSASPLVVSTNSPTSRLNLSWNGITNAHAKDYINYLNADDYTGTAAGHTYWPSNNCAWSSSNNAAISGSCSIETPFLPGRYKLAYYSGGSVPVGQPAPILAVSNLITVSNPSPTPSAILNVTPTTVTTKGTLTINWSGIPNPHLGDYMNFMTTDGKNGIASHTYWIHNNCTWFTPTSGTPKASGSCTIDLSKEIFNLSVPGPYSLILYSGTTPGVSTVIAKSNNFTIVNLSPTPSPNLCTVCSADVNKDGTVDTSDLKISSTCLNRTASGTCADADINKDGIIDVLDTACVGKNIGKTCIQPSPIAGKPLACGTYGDINGDKIISQADTQLVLDFIAKKTDFNDQQKLMADVDGNGKVDVLDSALLTRYTAGTSQTFPVCTTPTQIATTATPISIKGDFNKDRSVDILDYQIWRDEFLGRVKTKKADINNDGKVNIIDFGIWRNAFNP